MTEQTQSPAQAETPLDELFFAYQLVRRQACNANEAKDKERDEECTRKERELEKQILARKPETLADFAMQFLTTTIMGSFEADDEFIQRAMSLAFKDC